MEDPRIYEFDYSTYSQIIKILENTSTMQSFLGVLPIDCSSEDVLNAMDIEGRKYNMTPAKYLLQFLGSKEYRLSDLIAWFEQINLEKALVHLKKPDSLRIVEHPHELVRLSEGRELLLRCRATSFPLPEYQWYKGDEELLLHIEPDLIIKPTSLQDSGFYVCLVTKWNSETNSFDFLYSNPSHVEVFPSELHDLPSPEHDFPQLYPSTSNIILPRKYDYPMKTNDHDEVTASTHAGNRLLQPRFVLSDQNSSLSNNTEIIVITKHPYVNGKVAQGNSICLNCKAKCSIPVNYQWYKNGRPLPGEKLNSIVLNNLYPDTSTGERKWEYQCLVHNENYNLFSQTAVVELDEVNSTTIYEAQDKFAFVVANDTYDHLEDLKKPASDATDISKILSSMGFKVMALRNLSFIEMRNAFTFFCSHLESGSYVVFSFSGHGFDLEGQTYLQPVDCSKNELQQESICCEYILECLQETKPAINVFLIDACRKLPSNMNSSSKSQDVFKRGKIFKAKMKRNTIYGYSTSFLSAAHESDDEPNSVYVKHLKKYLTFRRSIEEVLNIVKEEFAKDPLTKNIQDPVVKSSLVERRTLWDSFQDESLSRHLYWFDIKGDVSKKIFKLSNQKTAIIVEFHHHKDVFCNGIDAFVYLLVEPGADLSDVYSMEIDISFKSPVLRVSPNNGIAVKNVPLQVNTKNPLFSKELLNVQRLDTQHLQGEVSVRFCSRNRSVNIPFSADIAKIAGLRLPINQLQSNNIEEQKYPVISNF